MHKNNLVSIKNSLKLLFLVFLIGLASPIQAVFCTVQKYSAPKTGKDIWLLGDVHFDIDPMGIPTRLQQHTLLEIAKKYDALVIAENVQFPSYNPYLWAAIFGANSFGLYKSLYEGQYINTAASIALFPMLLKLWNNEKEKTKKPIISMEKYLAEVKSKGITTLPLLNYSPLHNLVQKCSALGISAIDSEFRFHMIGAMIEHVRTQNPWFQQLGQWIGHANNFIERKITGNKMRYPLSLSDYCQVNDTIVKEIEEASLDNSDLKPFYEHCLQVYNESYITQQLKLLAANDKNQSLSTILPVIAENTGKNNDQTLLRDFIEHNKELLDARVVHEIDKNRDQQAIFVCVGAAHMPNISSQIEKLGYQKIASCGDENYKKLENLGVIGGQSIQTENLDCLIIDLEKVFAKS